MGSFLYYHIKHNNSILSIFFYFLKDYVSFVKFFKLAYNIFLWLTSRRPSIILDHLIKPLCEGGGASEDGGFLHFVALSGRHKAGYALKVPPTILTQTVQRTPGVPVAGRNDVTSCTNHVALHRVAPPVAATANTVLHYRQQGLQQFVRHGAMGVKVAPARDVTRGPMGEDLSRLWKTSLADAVVQNGALVQFQQGKIIAIGHTVNVPLRMDNNAQYVSDLLRALLQAHVMFP